jgi:hypothetical protein
MEGLSLESQPLGPAATPFTAKARTGRQPAGWSVSCERFSSEFDTGRGSDSHKTHSGLFGDIAFETEVVEFQ